MDQVISVIGAVLILVAYGASQAGWLKVERRSYSLLNFVGSALLTYVAIIGNQLGFILLEGAWAGISLAALIRGPAAR